MTQHCHGGTQNLSCPNFFEAVSAKDVLQMCRGGGSLEAARSPPHNHHDRKDGPPPHLVTQSQVRHD